MRTEQPLAILHRRLGARPEPVAVLGPDGDDPDGDEGDDGSGDEVGVPVPSWVPDGRPPRGQAWLSAIRADPGRSGGIALGVIGALAVLITVFTLVRDRPAPVVSAKLPPVEMVSSTSPSAAPGASPGPGSPTTAQTGQSVVVSVVGLVQQPGLVTLAPGARIADAVSAAGGPLNGADTVGLNLARHVADGEQIVVGIATPAGRPAALGSSVRSGSPETGPVAASTTPTGPVNLNTATVEQLDTLPGVGPVTAASIVAWRQANGKFNAIDQLGEVDGIGPARLEKLRPLVRI
jgi:competence protein ComEA